MARRITGTRRRSLVVASASITTLALFVWSPGAWASAGCTTSTPSLGQTIICNAAGTQNITIPDGANAVELIVIGGGGGGGTSTSSGDAGGAGGAGARVSASFRVSAGGSVTVVVGSEGSGGAGGGGGGYSSVVHGSTLLTAAGGGGGGGLSAGAQGGAGGSGAAAGTPAGGPGANADGSDTNGGGGGGADNAGGGGAAGIGGVANGLPGEAWSGGGEGGAGSGGTAGSGGSGYGGGGGGGGHGPDPGPIGNKARPGGGAGGSFANEDLLIGEATFGPSYGDAGSGGAGAPANTGATGSPGTAGWIQIRFIFIPSNTSGTPTQRSLVLTFDLPEGVNCSFKNVEASLGTWVKLPGAQDCTTSSADGPTLLGWATQADFPVQIAQRQVTNGWGAYETFDDSGALTGVFIPAGGFTLLSADTGLYPIWS